MANYWFNLSLDMDAFVFIVFFVSQAPKPCPYVRDLLEAAMFYTNRVLKEYKEK